MNTKTKSLFGAQDMTVGSPFLCLLMFAVPLLIGNIAQLLYTTVDAAIVGLYVGDEALSAIGSSTPIQHLFMVFFMAIGSGVTVMVSQYFGARDYDRLGVSIGNAITLIAIVSVLITAIATPFTGAMLRLVSTPPETYDMAKTYMVILFLGSAGTGFYNIMSGILRGLGDSVFPLIVLICTVILNTVLDLWFVAGLGWGIAGAAWATIIAQTLSAVVCLLKVLHMRGVVQIRPAHLRIDRRITGQMLRLGIPSGLSMAVMFLGTIFVQSIVNKMGFLVTAAITATIRLDGFAVLPSQTFNMVSSTFTGQNIGAGKLDRVKKGSRTVFLMCLVFTLVMVSAMLLFGRHMLRLFTDTESLIDMGMGFIRIMVPAYIAMVINQCFSGVMRGAGDAMGPMWISLAVNVLLRVPLAWALARWTVSEQWPAGNPDTLFYSLLIAMLVGAVVTLIYYRLGRWKNKAIIGAAAAEAAHDSPGEARA